MKKPLLFTVMYMYVASRLCVHVHTLKMIHVVLVSLHRFMLIKKILKIQTERKNSSKYTDRELLFRLTSDQMITIHTYSLGSHQEHCIHAKPATYMCIVGITTVYTSCLPPC